MQEWMIGFTGNLAADLLAVGVLALLGLAFLNRRTASLVFLQWERSADPGTSPDPVYALSLTNASAEPIRKILVYVDDQQMNFSNEQNEIVRTLPPGAVGRLNIATSSLDHPNVYVVFFTMRNKAFVGRTDHLADTVFKPLKPRRWRDRFRDQRRGHGWQ